MKLDGLHDIAVPDPVPWTPQTVGWAVLLVVLLFLAIGIVTTMVRRRRANRYRRLALARLGAIEAALARSEDRGQALAELPVLVKRTMLSVYPRAKVASLSGEPWLRFLDDTTDGTPFTTGPGRHLVTLSQDTPATVDRIPADDIDDLTRLVRRWIGGHRVRA
jgi:hypothetical protein